MQNRISSVQNKAVHIISFKNNFGTVKPLHKKLKILTFEKQVYFNDVLFVYDCLSKLNPKIFNDILQKSSKAHWYQTRGANS